MGSKYGRNWSEYVEYDENSPSGLVWKQDMLRGNQQSPYVFREKGSLVGSISSGGYWVLSTYSTFGDKLSSLVLHRIIYEMFYGPIDDDNLVVDHIDGNKLNNKIENLRLVGKQLNTRNANMYKNNTTGVVGVYLEQSEKVNRFKAMWMDLDGVQRSKSFNKNKYGDELAFQLACDYRKKMIDELNEQGAGYTERHGT